MSQPLPYKDFGNTNCVFLGEVLETYVFAESGYFLEADLRYPQTIGKDTTNFLLPTQLKD